MKAIHLELAGAWIARDCAYYDQEMALYLGNGAIRAALESLKPAP